MLDYVETTDVSTIVSVTPLPPSQHREQTPDSLMSMLSALLAHPEFQEGLVDGQEDFESSYEPAPLTEEEMVDEVEMDLSRAVTERCKKLSQLEGLDPPSRTSTILGVSYSGLHKD